MKSYNLKLPKPRKHKQKLKTPSDQRITKQKNKKAQQELISEHP